MYLEHHCGEAPALVWWCCVSRMGCVGWGVSAGQVAKICNNLVLGVSMIGVSEAFQLGISLGIDPSKLANIVNTSSGRSSCLSFLSRSSDWIASLWWLLDVVGFWYRCWSSDTYNPCPGVMDGVPSARRYTGGFGCDLMAKVHFGYHPPTFQSLLPKTQEVGTAAT